MHYAQVHQEASTNEEEEKDRCVLCMYQHWYSHWYPTNWSIPPVVLIMFQITVVSVECATGGTMERAHGLDFRKFI